MRVRWAELQEWVFAAKRATYGVAVMRILLGVAILGSLVTNFGTRHYVWGGGARWLTPYVDGDGYGVPFTTYFTGDGSPAVFTAKYLAIGVLAVLFVLGWRTRIVTPLLLITTTSLMRLDPLAVDAGDSVIRIMLLYLCFADVSNRWSLDARRGSAGDGSGRIPAWMGIVFHNAAIVAVAVQVFMIYVTSGLSKVQGEYWQEGVGLYYPLRIGQYEAWPSLNELVYSSGLVVTVGSYLTVFVQVFFPLLLMRRVTRIAALVTVGLMHIGIAVFMALPWFSLAMMAADAIFVRDASYWSVTRRVRRLAITNRSAQEVPARP